MSLRGTLAEAGGPKQSRKLSKTKRLPRCLLGVYPEVLEGLAMTRRDCDTGSKRQAEREDDLTLDPPLGLGFLITGPPGERPFSRKSLGHIR